MKNNFFCHWLVSCVIALFNRKYWLGEIRYLRYWTIITGSQRAIFYQSPDLKGYCPEVGPHRAPCHPRPHPTNSNPALESPRENRGCHGLGNSPRRTGYSPNALLISRPHRRTRRPSARAHRPPSHPKTKNINRII